MYIDYVEVFNSVQTENTEIEVNDPIDYGFITQASAPLEGADDKIIEEDSENDIQTVESLEEKKENRFQK